MWIFPLHYFPSIPWFCAALQQKELILEVHQHYRKQQYTTRCEIMTANGPSPLIIPVGRKGLHIPLWQKSISYKENWQLQHWRSIVYAYKNSPYFEYYADDLRICFEDQENSLIEYNLKALRKVFELIGIEINIKLTQKYLPPSEFEFDLRTEFEPRERKLPSWFQIQKYQQVFGDFVPALSILDLVFNEGPNTKILLSKSFALQE